MSATLGESRFEWGDDGESQYPDADVHVFVEYVNDGRYALMVRNPHWKPNDPTPNGVSILIEDRLYGAVAIGEQDAIERMAEALGPTLADQDGIWVNSILEWIFDVIDEPLDALSKGEHYWWVVLGEWGPYPGDDWFLSQGVCDDDDDEEDLTGA